MISIKTIIDLIEQICPISGNSIVDSILFAIIGIIAFSIAFGLVGMIFDAIGLYDSDIMSDVHWGIRLIVFVALYAVFVGVAKLVNWFCSFQWWVYLIIVILIISIIVVVHVIQHKKAKKTFVKPVVNETIKVENVIVDKKDYCPRCGGKLVKRHGPFGDFYGCENFPTKDCRYTRNYK